jgi:hypothetical protein
VRFVRELASPNPDLTALHSFESVLITLRPDPLTRALGPAEPSFETGPESRDQGDDAPGLEGLRAGVDERQAYSWDPEGEESDILESDLDPEELEADPDPETIPEPEPPSRCAFCGGRLPAGRPVNFCPHCGQSQALILCPECRSEVEPGWKHCVNCGRAVAER